MLPTGTVTFAFTDIENSTALLRTLGDGYAEMLAAHRRIVRDRFGANGVEIDTQGDAFFFAFPRARQAVAAAAEVQRAHVAHEWPHDAAVRVRIGLHTGEPHVAEEGYLGLDVVRAARICTAARGGQVLLSESTRALLGSALPDGVAVFPRGERHLKGIEEPERLYELAIDGLEVEHRSDGDASLEPRSSPAPSEAPSTTEQVIEQRFDELGRRLAAGIEEQVARKLEHAFDRLGAAPVRSDEEDADVENLAARSAALDEKIRAQVDAALRDRGIPSDEEQD
jgi:class 3 adenylate cyclase